MNVRQFFQLFVLSLPILISACRPYHATPFDALTEWPGKLEGNDAVQLKSVQVLAEEEVAGGRVILYSFPSEETGKNLLVGTFVTPSGNGWRAQSSGGTDYSSSDDFVASGIAGGNITALTTVFGISNKGNNVRIQWSDGQIDTVHIEEGAFILSRPETLAVQRVVLLDTGGEILETREFAGKNRDTQAQTATLAPDETAADKPTAIPELITPTPVSSETKTDIPQVDFLVDTILSNDLDARQALVQFVTAGCTTADGLGTVPRCEEGQVEGTLVDFLPLGGPGEGHSVLAAEVTRVLDFEAEALYAAYVVSDELPVDPDYPHGTYALFFTVAGVESDSETIVLRVDNEGHIVRLDKLGNFPVDTYFQQKVADLIDPPPQTEIFHAEASEILVYPPEIQSADGDG